MLATAAIGAVVFLGFSLLWAFPAEKRQSILAFAIGASAGLIAAQVVQVHLFTIMVVVWALLGQRTSLTWTPREVVMVLSAAVLLASTALYGELVNSPTLGLQLIALAISASLIVIYGSKFSVTRMLYGLLAVTSAASFWALLQVVGLAPNDAWHLDVSALGRPTGFYPEPDWLGMFSGIGITLAWRLPLTRGLRIILIVANLSVWILAFARAAWVAVVAAAALAFVVHLIRESRTAGNEPKRARSGRVAALAIAAAAGTIAFYAIPSLHSDVLNRLSRTLVARADDVSAQARVQQNEGLFHLAATAPWNGWGISSSGRVGVSGILNLSGDARNNVGSNWIVSMWVDGAWLALPVIAVLLLAAILSVRTIQSQLLVLTLLSSIFSNATFQPITWLLVGACLWYLRDKREAKALTRLNLAQFEAAKLKTFDGVH